MQLLNVGSMGAFTGLHKHQAEQLDRVVVIGGKVGKQMMQEGQLIALFSIRLV